MTTEIDQTTRHLQQPVDLNSCDREPIHVLGRVQSFGALVAVTSDWIVHHASANLEAFLGIGQDEAVGSPLVDLVGSEVVHEVRGRMQTLSGTDAVARAFAVRVRDDLPLLDVAVHLSGRSIILEFERAEDGKRTDYSVHVRPMMDRVSKADSIEDLCNVAAKQLRALTGFDRVMVYRFEADNSGTVIAEHRKPGMDSFLGLRYPASDIPKQARALYKRSLLRIIADVDDPGVPIEPYANPEGTPLDLSLSTTRAVSPIHLEYLKNMGVGASLSVSILKRGELWGLFACHHERQRALPYEVRTAAELFGQLFGFVLDQKESDLERQDVVKGQILHDQLMAQLADGATIGGNFETIVRAIADVVPFDGAVGWFEGEYVAEGSVPTREEFLGLMKFLNTTAASRVYQTEALSQVYPPAESFSSRAAGILVLPVSRTPRDYIVLFRKEVARSVTWAGNPEKSVAVGPNGARLTPRKSFEAWQQAVDGTCTPWTRPEVRAAEALRVTLIEVVLRLTDAAMQDKTRAQQHQELLITELNHRVRNILNLIRSLVSLSKPEAKTAAEFTSIIGGRIHALARAHDQITAAHWKPSSAHRMIATEIEAYLGQKKDRTAITGPDVLLEPDAFAKLSLVFHELVTNAAKYGALSDSRGTISIDFDAKEDGALEIKWQERGGPPITMPPERRGFGSTIIERSIPYELKGEAEMAFEATGLKARFMVPPSYVSAFVSPDDERAVPVPEIDGDRTARLSGDVLVVEDNMIIALDAEAFLADLGADRVHVAASTNEAIEIASSCQLTFAVLDVNLGQETSEAIARLLSEQGVFFVFATGYGDGTAATRDFPGVPIMQKPYDQSHLENELIQQRERAAEA